MKELNKLRLAAGLTIDPAIEITEKHQITEARETPRRKSDLKQVDGKSLKAKVRGVSQAVKHINAAVQALEKIPPTDFSGDVPRFIGELEDLLDAGGSTGMEGYLEMITSEQRKFEGSEKQKARREEEEEAYNELEAKREEAAFDAEVEADEKAAADMATEDKDIGEFIKDLSAEQLEHIQAAMDALRNLTDGMIGESEEHAAMVDIFGDRIEEAMHYYTVNYDGHEDDKEKPINVADGSTNDEQVWDDEEEEKNESPTQLKTMDQQDNSEQDKSGDDLSNPMKIPNGIKQALRTEIEKAKKEAARLDVRDKDASYFYKDLAKAFGDLLGHLEKGTVYDFKQAQNFAQTFMGPMLHKIPTNVWKFLTNGGETRSLKSIMTDVSKKYPITGPRNTLK